MQIFYSSKIILVHTIVRKTQALSLFSSGENDIRIARSVAEMATKLFSLSLNFPDGKTLGTGRLLRTPEYTPLVTI